MASSRSPPASPTKSKSSFSLQNLLNGVNQSSSTNSTKPTTSKSKPLLPINTNSKGVAHMVKAYETATLNSSSNNKPSKSKQQQPIPISTNNVTSTSIPTNSTTSTSTSPTTRVPASFFQQAHQSRKTPDKKQTQSNTSNNPSSPGKENVVRQPLVLLSSSTSTAQPSSSAIESSHERLTKASNQVESTRAGNRRSRVGESLIINVNASNNVTPTSSQPSSPSSNRFPRDGPPITPKSPARASRFREELPRTAPRMNTSYLDGVNVNVSPLPLSFISNSSILVEPPLIPVPTLSNSSTDKPTKKVRGGGTRRRASTITNGEATSNASSSAMTYVEGYEEVLPETESEKIERVESEFIALLDTMQLPSTTVRDRMMTLTIPLKIEMLRSANSSPATTPRLRSESQSKSNSSNKSNSTKSTSSKINTFLRKSKSSVSLVSKVKYSDTPTPSFSSSSTSSTSSSTSNSSKLLQTPKTKRPAHNRSLSATQLLFKSLGISNNSNSSLPLKSPLLSQESGGDKEDPSWWAARLRSTKCGYISKQSMSGKGVDGLSVGDFSILRARLRAESPAWVEEFLKNDGYLGLLERLKELLDLEWREEQHDDYTLHELLKCFKALSLTNAGKLALSSQLPIPYTSLVKLLFSEKKPGDLAPRLILVELILSLFEIYPEGARLVESVDWKVEIGSSSTTSVSFTSGSIDVNDGSGGRRYIRKMKDEEESTLELKSESSPEVEVSEERKRSTHEFVKSLMMGPPDEKAEQQIEFISSLHRPRLYKVWVTELGDCVRDYFWIFCHSQNQIWTLSQLNPDSIEAPKVPSGMTGGVEFDSMMYCSSHFRLINAIAEGCATREIAMEFHVALFESGLERIILTLRRASQEFYPVLHLELARYIHLARKARFNLGPKLFSFLDFRVLNGHERQVLMDYSNQRRLAQAGPSTPMKGTPQIGALNF